MSPSSGRIRLATLGAVDLHSGAGVRITSVLAQPKRTALLVYLALARPHGMLQREKLMALFWEERDEEQARHALRQSLYYLRSSIGADIFVTQGDAAVGVDPERLWCDVVELEAAATAGRCQDVLAHYTGELLPGFHVDGAPEFEDWLCSEREWLRLRVQQAALAASVGSETCGDLPSAIRFARRGVEVAPAEEALVRRVAELHVSAGDRVSALRALDALKERLWRDYELTPSSETLALAERISAAPQVRTMGPAPTASGVREAPADAAHGSRPTAPPPHSESETGNGSRPTAPAQYDEAPADAGNGSRPAAPAQHREPADPAPTRAAAQPPPPVQSSTPDPPPPVRIRSPEPPPLRRWHRPRRAAEIILAVLLLAGGVVGLRVMNEHQLTTSHRLAVLPFDRGGDAVSASFADGLHGDLQRQLTRVAGLRVVPHGSVTGDDGALTPYRRIARELSVAHVLTGAVVLEGARVRIRAQLINAQSNEFVWAETYEDSLTADNLYAIQASMATSIARALELRLSPTDSADIGSAPTRVVEALDHYYRGRTLYDEQRTVDGVAASVSAFERAVELDPDFANAWAALSIARGWLVRFSVQEDLAPVAASLARARRLSSSAEVELATAYYAYHARGDFEESLRSARRAQRLWPGDAEVRIVSALSLRRLGRWSEALEEHAAALELDPRSLAAVVSYAQTLMLLHRWEEADQLYRRMTVLTPQSGVGETGQLRIALRARADTARARRIVAELPAGIAPAAAANARFELALAVRDFSGAVAAADECVRLAAQPPPNTVPLPLTTSSAWHPRLALAVSLHLAGREAGARAHADTLRLLAAAQLARLTPVTPVDPQGRRASPLVHHAIALALLGERDGAVRDAAAATSLYNERVDAVDGPTVRELAAMAYALAGEGGRAVEELELVADGPSNHFAPNLSLNPAFASLERLPRYRALTSRVPTARR